MTGDIWTSWLIIISAVILIVIAAKKEGNS